VVADFPLVIINDQEGRDLYDEAVRLYGRPFGSSAPR